MAAVGDIDGWDAYQLCYDTFQSFRWSDTQLFPERIGLAHMSGIARTDLAAGDLTEPNRGLIFVDDRVGNIPQLRALRATGYSGFVSMESFSPGVQNDPELAAHLRASLDYVSALLKATDWSIRNPRNAHTQNIETIIQTLALADNLDAASNLLLGREIKRRGIVDDAMMEAETRKIMCRLNPNFRKLNVAVSALSGGQRQSVA